MKTKAVLRELFDLLEAYAPAWYTEDQRTRAAAALRHGDQPQLHLVMPDSGSHAPNAIPPPPSLAPDPQAAIDSIAVDSIKVKNGTYIQ
jgi:hypothetical protein